MANHNLEENRGASFSPQAVQDELSRLLADELFANSPALIRFLKYTIGEALAGHGESLKEILLGRKVFDRGEEFDPRLDPIVRVQAGKLRAKLAEYYKERGAADPVRIEFPKGSYSPHFSEPGSEPATALPPAPPPAPRRRNRIALLAGAAVLLILPAAWLRMRSSGSSQDKITLTQLTFEAGSAMKPAISRDGRLLAFSSDRGPGDLNIWIRPVEGGTPVQLTHDPAADHTPDFSPDAAWIVFRSHRQGGGLFVVPVLGGEERKLVTDGWNPRFSPDGRSIAYLGTGSALYVVPFAGGQPRRVETGGIDAFLGPIWTPDGGHFVFSGVPHDAKASRPFEWYSVPVNGGRALPSGLRDQLRAQGLPEPGLEGPGPGDWLGNAIVFSLRRGKAANIWKVPISRRTLRVAGPAEQLTAGTGAETFPRCSDTGRMVLTSEEQLTHVFSLDVDPRTGAAVGPRRQLTSDSSLGTSRTYARLSADGTKVAFVSSRSGSQEVVVRDVEGGRESPLSLLPRQETLPLIWGDESLLVYGRDGDDFQTIYAADPGKTFAQRICDRCGTVLDWSPDGRKILMEAPSRKAIELWDRDNGKRSQLLEYPVGNLSYATLAPGQNWFTVTSPTDGVKIAPVQDRPLRPDQLISLGSAIGQVSAHWSQDGNTLYFFTRLDDYSCLWGQRLDPRTKRPQGAPFALQHFHTNRLMPWGSWISAGARRLVFTLTEPRSNVWLGTLDAPAGSGLR